MEEANLTLNQEVTQESPESKKMKPPVSFYPSFRKLPRPPQKTLQEPYNCLAAASDTHLYLNRRLGRDAQAQRVIKLLEQNLQQTRSSAIERLLEIIRIVQTDSSQASALANEVLRLRVSCSQDKRCRVAAELAYSFFKSQRELRTLKRGASASTIKLDLDKISNLRDELSSRGSVCSPFQSFSGESSLGLFLSECITAKLNLEPRNPAQKTSGHDLYKRACSLKVPPTNWPEFIRQELASARPPAARVRRMPRSGLPFSIS